MQVIKSTQLNLLEKLYYKKHYLYDKSYPILLRSGLKSAATAKLCLREHPQDIHAYRFKSSAKSK